MDKEDLVRYKKWMIESLKLFALTYENQVKCFPDFVDVPFEVVDAFDKAFLLLPQVIEEEDLNYRTIANLLRINNNINLIINKPEFKDLDETQFASSEEWDKIRRMAKDTLHLMGEVPENPDLNFI